MPTNRANAVTGDTVVLEIEVRDPDTCALFNVDQTVQVEILDDTLATTVETIASASITNPSTGIYRVTAAAITTAADYHDRWTLVVESGDPQTTSLQDFTVATAPVAPTPGTGVFTVAVHVIDTVVTIVGESSITDQVPVPDIEVLVSNSTTTQRLQTGTTGGNGQVSFNLAAGSYTFSIRDVADSVRVFATNNQTHTVVDPETNATGAADPNIITFNGRSFRPEWSPGSPLASTDLCTLTGTVVGLDGQPLRDVTVNVMNRFVPSIQSTAAVLGDNLTFTTQADGIITLVLVRNADVTVAIHGTGITRDITVPNAATGALFTLVGAGQDLFTIIQDNTLTVPARTL